jgi:hypothetical protein
LKLGQKLAKAIAKVGQMCSRRVKLGRKNDRPERPEAALVETTSLAPHPEFSYTVTLGQKHHHGEDLLLTKFQVILTATFQNRVSPATGQPPPRSFSAKVPENPSSWIPPREVSKKPDANTNSNPVIKVQSSETCN